MVVFLYGRIYKQHIISKKSCLILLAATSFRTGIGSCRGMEFLSYMFSQLKITYVFMVLLKSSGGACYVNVFVCV